MRDRVGRMNHEQFLSAQAALGYVFADPTHFHRAMTHASVSVSRQDSNERMEFLGDAVLGMVCCELIYQLYPDLLEGEMTKIKSTVVSRHTCAAMARELGLDELLTLGKGMLVHRELPPSLAAATLEAAICAIYLDAAKATGDGMSAARAFLVPRLTPLIHRAAQSGHQENFKSVLQQHAHQRMGHSPNYLVLDEKGPDHSKCFEVAVEIAGKRFASSWGATKKQAEQQAALIALGELGLAVREASGQVRVVAQEMSVEKPALARSSGRRAKV